MNKGVLWRGKYFVIPQAASYIDSSALARSPLGGNNKLAVLGEMTGLIQPKTAKKINNPSLALQLLHPASEEARLASQLVFDPSPGSGTPGASEVYLVPVNPATGSSIVFGNSVLTLTSYMYGAVANQIRAKIESGTATGKKVTIQFQDTVEVFDNLAKSAFSVQYTGAAETASMSIAGDGSDFTLTLVVGDPNGVEENTLSLNTYNTIKSVVDYLNATGVYTATILTAQPNDSSCVLDLLTDQDVKTTAYTVKANLQAIVDGLTRSGYVQATRTASLAAAPANAAWAYLTGGADGTTANSDWQTSFDLLKSMDINLLLVLSDDASIHAMADSHCDYMSGPNGKSERQCFVGGALQSWANENARAASQLALETAAKALNSDLTMHVGLGSYHYDPTGALKLYPAYITAAMYAGMAAGSSPVEPLTRKYLRCYGLEVELRVSEIEDLLEAGVAVPVPDKVNGAGYVISRGLTTYSQDNDLAKIEFSIRRGSFYVAKEVRKRHELIIGKPGTELMDRTIINLTNAVLQDCLTAGYIREYDPKKTVLRVDNTIRYIDYWAQPIMPINWIFSTYFLQPTYQTITL